MGFGNGDGFGGGGGTSPALTVEPITTDAAGDALEIGAYRWSAKLTLSNADTKPVPVELSLDGADAADIVLLGASQFDADMLTDGTDVVREIGASIPSITAIVVPAEGEAVVYVARAPVAAPSAPGAVSDCALTLTQLPLIDGGAARTLEIAITAQPLGNATDYANSLGVATHIYDFESGSEYVNKADPGTNDATNASGTRGAATQRGCLGEYTLAHGTGQYLSIPAAPTRAADFSAVEFQANTETVMASSLGWSQGTPYDGTNMPFTKDTINGNGTAAEGSDSLSSPTSVCFRLARQGAAAVFSDANCLKAGDYPTMLRTSFAPQITQPWMDAITWDASPAGMRWFIAKADQRKLKIFGPQDLSFGATSTPSEFRLGAYPSANAHGRKCHWFAFFSRILTRAEIATFAMLFGALAPMEVEYA